MTSALGTVRASIAALLAAQRADGLWQDYDLPVGRSDEWAAAFVGLALAGASAALRGIPGEARLAETAMGAARTCHEALISRRARPAGFGFNAHVAADADSTATVVLLGHAVGRKACAADRAFLVGLTRGDGVATFDGPQGWGDVHGCVTPVVSLALRICGDPVPPARVRRQARALRDADGTWPSYWWEGPFYATAAWLRLAAHVPGGIDATPPAPGEWPIVTAMDLALAVEIARAWAPQNADHLARALCGLQGGDGLWPPSRTLRVTDWDCRPGDPLSGPVHADPGGLMTSATALRALAGDLEPRGHR